jgi:uncharacterized peroxidase-related enzyme
MAHIDLKNDYPGILGPMAFKPETGLALNQLAEAALRGNSTLTQGERELIAGCVSFWNNCNFCHRSHAAAAEFCLKSEPGFTKSVAQNVDGAPITEKMKALLKIAHKVQQDGKKVQTADIDLAKSKGATDMEIHDTVLVAAAFCMFNRYVDGLGTFAPEEGAPYYFATGERLGTVGYLAPKPT